MTLIFNSTVNWTQSSKTIH